MNSYLAKSAAYDRIATEYDATEFAIAKQYSYGPSFIKLCGNLKGKHVVDAACGSGYSTRLLARYAQPARIVGLDESEKMTELARNHERKQPLGIEYECGNVADFDFHALGRIDVITALFLLHYATSEEHLFRLCSAISAALPPGGKFISITSNPSHPEMLHKKYEVTSALVEGKREGAPRVVTYWKDDKPLCSFETRYWSLETIRRALEQTGFLDIAFHEPIVSDEGRAAFGEQFWEDYRKEPHIVGITCTKQHT